MGIVIGLVNTKGGVGKSMLSSNIVVALNDLGHKTALIDAEEGGPTAEALARFDSSIVTNCSTKLEEIDEQISKLPRGSNRRRALELMFSGQSVQLSVDETGRLVLSPKLRDKINIKSEAIFVATGDTFQIWEPSAYDEYVASLEDWIEEEVDDVDPLTLLDTSTLDGAEG